jgi:hypothetical protein
MTIRSPWLSSAVFVVFLTALPALAQTKASDPPPVPEAPLASDAPVASAPSLTPARDPAQPPSPARPGASHPNWVMVGVGAGMTYVSYGMAAGSAAMYSVLVWPIASAIEDDTSYSPTMAWLFLPLAGPFLAAQTDLLKDQPGWRTAMYVDGAAQVVGAGLLLAGFLARVPEPPVAAGERASASPVFMVGPGPGGTAGLSFLLALN